MTISAGTSVTDSSAAAAMAKVLVKASGRTAALLALQREDRQEGDGDDQKAEEQSRADLARRLDQNVDALLARRGAFEMLVGVLDHHDRRVDHRADGDGDAAQLMILEPSPSACIAMKAISTPIGSMMMATSALRTCSRKITQTSATMTLSSNSVCFSVSIAA